MNTSERENSPRQTPSRKMSKVPRLPEDKEPIRVVMRAKPHASSVVQIISENSIKAKPPKESVSYKNGVMEPQTFHFSKVFPSDSSQQEIFTDVCLPLLDNLCKGKNGLLFSYGVTNAGKVFSKQKDILQNILIFSIFFDISRRTQSLGTKKTQEFFQEH